MPYKFIHLIDRELTLSRVRTPLFLLCIVSSILTSALPSETYAQHFNCSKPNKTKNGLRHGWWISYADSTSTTPEWKGRFKKGNEKGIWKYYHSNGTLRKKEIYRFKKIRTYTYYPSGKIESFGFAKLEDGKDKLEYFYYGPWTYYSEDGNILRIVHYEKGIVIKEEIIK